MGRHSGDGGVSNSASFELLRSVARGRVECQWLLSLLRERLVSFSNQLRDRATGESASPVALRRLLLEARAARLRMLLRDVPFWISGQLRLGLVCAEQELLADTGRSPRGLQTIRLQQQAAEMLLKQKGELTPGRHAAECRYLTAIHAFLKREFVEALREFRVLLTPELEIQLSADEYFSALEHAGASALAVGDKQGAFEFFSRIPDPKRSGETVAALSFLTEQFEGASRVPPLNGCKSS